MRVEEGVGLQNVGKGLADGMSINKAIVFISDNIYFQYSMIGNCKSIPYFFKVYPFVNSAGFKCSHCKLQLYLN